MRKIPGSGLTVIIITGRGPGVAGRKPEPLDQGGQDDAGLHHGEVRADTDARARAKGQILILVQLAAIFSCEPAGIELGRPLPPHFMTMQRPDRQENNVIGLDLAAAQFVFRQRGAGQKPDRRIKPHRFFQNLLDQRHGFKIVRDRRRGPSAGA